MHVFGGIPLLLLLAAAANGILFGKYSSGTRDTPSNACKRGESIDSEALAGLVFVHLVKH
ncbi:hypothetical protein HPB50_005277 [Hyalomma asiaticum]|uniref:Uncharacterized protein n=1 Tax=Hyalomma asiaticum TaxID=266040 RepID=A0ACB7T1A3_HYAAI|nr:hypothetical protein HPB50_005277 [Hyalomma asiaticum]